MRFSAENDKISPALVKAYGEIHPVVKDASNPFFKSKYADIAAIDAVVRPILAKHGLAVLQGIRGVWEEDEERIVMVTLLVHTSGQWVESYVPYIVAQGKGGPQEHGSGQTYARRYGLQAILALATEDDDGNAAQRGGGSTADVRQPGKSATAPAKKKATKKRGAREEAPHPGDEKPKTTKEVWSEEKYHELWEKMCIGFRGEAKTKEEADIAHEKALHYFHRHNFPGPLVKKFEDMVERWKHTLEE